jgi:hypothetical protein
MNFTPNGATRPNIKITTTPTVIQPVSVLKNCKNQSTLFRKKPLLRAFFNL